MAGHPHEGARQDTQAASRCRLLAQADLGKDPDQAGLAPAGAGPGDGHDAERRGQPLSGFLALGLGAVQADVHCLAPVSVLVAATGPAIAVAAVSSALFTASLQR